MQHTRIVLTAIVLGCAPLSEALAWGSMSPTATPAPMVNPTPNVPMVSPAPNVPMANPAVTNPFGFGVLGASVPDPRATPVPSEGPHAATYPLPAATTVTTNPNGTLSVNVDQTTVPSGAPPPTDAERAALIQANTGPNGLNNLSWAMSYGVPNAAQEAQIAAYKAQLIAGGNPTPTNADVLAVVNRQYYQNAQRINTRN